MNIERLIKSNEFSIRDQECTLSPQQGDFLHGEIGEHYLLVAINESPYQDTRAYAENTGSILFNDLKVDRLKTITKTFQMGRAGFITVMNKSDVKHAASPRLHFKLFPT